MSELLMETENFTEYNFNQSFKGLDYGSLVPVPSKNPSGTDDTIMPLWVQIAWTTIFSLMILTATGGNTIVIWIVVAHRRMRTVTNYFLVNLSLADLLLTTFNCFFNFIYMIQRNWPFGSWYCTVSNFIANATVAASVFTLTGISCDRYLAIVHPLHPRMSKTSSLITIMIIWFTSMLFAFPCLLYSTTITNRYRGKEQTGCILVWPDGKLIGSEFDFAYQMVFLIITYVIPVTLMTMSYTIMGKELWGSRSIGELTQRQIDSIRSKRKVVKMFILIVFIFAICWLPYHGYFLYIYYDPNVIFNKYTQHVYLGFYWFAMSNAMVNPLIYYWMNARFRQYFKTAICGWKNCVTHTSNGRIDSPPAIGRHSHSYSRSGIDGNTKTKHMHLVNNHHHFHNSDSLLHRHTTITKVQVDEEKNFGRSSTRRWKRRSTRKSDIKTTANL